MENVKKIVLITGCSSGIGQALAETLHIKGYKVYASARNIHNLTALSEQGINTLELDITDSESIQNTINRITSCEGRLDILINNAGYGAMGPIAEIPMTELRRQFETNLIGHVAVIQAAIPLMQRNQSSLIINIGSVSGIFTTPFSGAYCATKAAFHSLSDALRMELAPFNIQVVTVQPGAIESSFGRTATRELIRTLPEDSMYEPVAKAIRKRAGASQDNPTSAREFARVLAAKMERKKMPPVIRIGYGSRAFPLLERLLPIALKDRILALSFNLKKLNRST